MADKANIRETIWHQMAMSMAPSCGMIVAHNGADTHLVAFDERFPQHKAAAEPCVMLTRGEIDAKIVQRQSLHQLAVSLQYELAAKNGLKLVAPT